MTTVTDIGSLIVQTPGICGGRPRIAGTRIAVQNIVIDSNAGMTPQAILEDKLHLTLAGIYAALAYYYTNKESMDADIAAYFEECDRLEAEYRARKLA